MTPSSSLLAVVDPVIGLIQRRDLREALQQSFEGERESVRVIERCFELLPTKAWSPDFLRTLVCSWKATHLKMLAIYGLSCRLQRMATTAGPANSNVLYIAGARNAETSYEDLGLDFDAQTHAELYDNFAEALVGDDSWQLRQYKLPEAHQFSRWVYRNMVVEDIAVGLFSNMFSEIYNHGEYSIALPAFTSYFAQHTPLTPQQRESAITYVNAHVEDDTEKAHFLVVVDAMERFYEATGRQFDGAQAEGVFRGYLQRLAPVMRTLTNRMQDELSTAGASSSKTRVA
jgi:hypothetical protein